MGAPKKHTMSLSCSVVIFLSSCRQAALFGARALLLPIQKVLVGVPGLGAICNCSKVVNEDMSLATDCISSPLPWDFSCSWTLRCVLRDILQKLWATISREVEHRNVQISPVAENPFPSQSNLAITQRGGCGLCKLVEVSGIPFPWTLKYHLAPFASRFHFKTCVMAQHSLSLPC